MIFRTEHPSIRRFHGMLGTLLLIGCATIENDEPEELGTSLGGASGTSTDDSGAEPLDGGSGGNTVVFGSGGSDGPLLGTGGSDDGSGGDATGTGGDSSGGSSSGGSSSGGTSSSGGATSTGGAAPVDCGDIAAYSAGSGYADGDEAAVDCATASAKSQSYDVCYMRDSVVIAVCTAATHFCDSASYSPDSGAGWNAWDFARACP